MTDLSEETLANFIESFYEDVSRALDVAGAEDMHPQYRLGVRRLAKAFFDKFELFEIKGSIPHLQWRDVDEWYAGR